MGPIRLGRQEASQRESYETAGKSSQPLPPGYGLRHSFRQLIESVVHRFSPVASGTFTIIHSRGEEILKRNDFA
jgi:hypothetical protein